MPFEDNVRALKSPATFNLYKDETEVPIDTFPRVLYIFELTLFHTFEYEFDISSFPNIRISENSSCVPPVPIF